MTTSFRMMAVTFALVLTGACGATSPLPSRPIADPQPEADAERSATVTDDSTRTPVIGPDCVWATFFGDWSVSRSRPAPFVGPFSEPEAYCDCLARAIARRTIEVGLETEHPPIDSCVRFTRGSGAELENASPPVLEGTMLDVPESVARGSGAYSLPAIRTARGFWVAPLEQGFVQPESAAGRTLTEILSFSMEDIVPGIPGAEIVIRTKETIYELAEDGYEYEREQLTVCGVDADDQIRCATFQLSEVDRRLRRENWRFGITFADRAAVVSVIRPCGAEIECLYTDEQRIALPFGW